MPKQVLHDKSSKLLNLMKLKKNIATSENGFIFNPASGDSFSGNTIAAEILILMKTGKTDTEIKQEILQKYDVKPAQLEQDWDDWILQLKDADLLE
ncbi:MAG: PqqD family protein [Sphingobacteriaceae bacterium]|nr:MAG: PqqD family protein [Sphingobacteriaceae bacterium]